MKETDEVEYPVEKAELPHADKAKYCEFHHIHGHTTEDCFTLRDYIYDLSDNGEIDWELARQHIASKQVGTYTNSLLIHNISAQDEMDSTEEQCMFPTSTTAESASEPQTPFADTAPVDLLSVDITSNMQQATMKPEDTTVISDSEQLSEIRQPALPRGISNDSFDELEIFTNDMGLPIWDISDDEPEIPPVWDVSDSDEAEQEYKLTEPGAFSECPYDLESPSNVLQSEFTPDYMHQEEEMSTAATHSDAISIMGEEAPIAQQTIAALYDIPDAMTAQPSEYRGMLRNSIRWLWNLTCCMLLLSISIATVPPWPDDHKYQPATQSSPSWSGNYSLKQPVDLPSPSWLGTYLQRHQPVTLHQPTNLRPTCKQVRTAQQFNATWAHSFQPP